MICCEQGTRQFSTRLGRWPSPSRLFLIASHLRAFNKKRPRGQSPAWSSDAKAPGACPRGVRRAARQSTCPCRVVASTGSASRRAAGFGAGRLAAPLTPNKPSFMAHYVTFSPAARRGGPLAADSSRAGGLLTRLEGAASGTARVEGFVQAALAMFLPRTRPVAAAFDVIRAE